MPHEGDEEKGERCETLLAVDDDASRFLVDVICGIEQRSDEMPVSRTCGARYIEPKLLALTLFPSVARW